MPRDEQIALLEQAAGALAGVRGPLRARVLACLARELHHSWEEDNLARAPAVAEEAVALARELDDPATLGFCLLALHDARWRPGTARDRLPLVEEMLTPGRRRRRPRAARPGAAAARHRPDRG